MDSQKVLTVRPVEWSEDAENALSEAVPCVTDIRYQRGAHLFEVTAESGRVGFYVLRVDITATGAEGVLVAAAGSLASEDLTETLLTHIEGQFSGCRSMRIHTARPGLARKLARRGYSAGEIVLRKTL